MKRELSLDQRLQKRALCQCQSGYSFLIFTTVFFFNLVLCRFSDREVGRAVNQRVCLSSKLKSSPMIELVSSPSRRPHISGINP